MSDKKTILSDHTSYATEMDSSLYDSLYRRSGTVASNKTVLVDEPTKPAADNPNITNEVASPYTASNQNNAHKTVVSSLYESTPEANGSKTIVAGYHDEDALYAGYSTPQPILVGVLYSSSRYTHGEMFPLYMGTNSIGSGSDNKVCLNDELVGNNHANLYVEWNDALDPQLEFNLESVGQAITYVGDIQVSDKGYCLQENDIICLGGYQLQVKMFSKAMMNGRPSSASTQPSPNSGSMDDFYSRKDESNSAAKTKLYTTQS